MLSSGEWIKSSFSGDGGACVEVSQAPDTGLIGVRDSKNPDQPALWYTRAEWAAFLGGAKDGEFDL